jgi:hypothetical protein
LEEVRRREKHLYEKSRGSPIFQKAWNDKMKGKNDQRKKVLSHPFSRTTSNKISKVNQPKMSTRLEIHLGKSQGNSLYNVGDVREITYIEDCPHKGEIMRTLHNIQEAEIVEYMGGKMPRIYASLDNKQENINPP